MSQELSRTPLHSLHIAAGARMVPFAGHAMPLNYPGGAISEHRAVRSACGLFDVSHMGQITVGLSCATALETLVTADLGALPAGKQAYALMTSPWGGILDDLMIARWQDGFLLVVNGACRDADLALLCDSLGRENVRLLHGHGLLALQGPLAAATLGAIIPGVEDLYFMETADFAMAGENIRISRSGYTGEDGFEISLAAEAALALAQRLSRQPGTSLCGLAARDSLRLEAALPLCGQDIHPRITPVEARLAWCISPRRRQDARFSGAGTILGQLADGPARLMAGLRPRDRSPVRAGSTLRSSTGHVAGEVTSGGFSPTLGHPVAMGLVAAEHATPGTLLTVRRRGRETPVEVVRTPFVPRRYHRKQAKPDQIPVQTHR